ncbi:MAG: organic solvent ABC transporter permease [Bdellovibrio sp.]|nr:MAG: organic solvent ABC transporter permease [Bdellovibrio sp.]
MVILNSVIDEIGSALLFFVNILKTLMRRPCSRDELFQQIWKVTMQSLVTTGLAGFFVGAIMAVQFTLQMREFGALGYLGGLATSATVREVGPLLIAFMLAGKVGAFTSAELGTMRVTEQLDAIRCLGADPLQEIILPRFLAIICASFFLLGLGLVMSIGGGILLGGLLAQVSVEEYLRHIPAIVTLSSIANGLVKCFIFAVILATVCTYKGYTTTGGAKGVGLAVVNTAVSTMVGIVVADWLTSFIADVAIRAFVGSPF